ncbi:MAG: sigma-70 family RNA polymerase sigma factor [Gemmataceae bacterium]|nr:sigma-70 family RNA polymerase sigma factor [Gemmataceae bacterium]
MSTTGAGVILRHIRGLAADGGEAPDRDLLERFTAAGDEAAFEALVRRHGPLVLGVCRRVLGNTHDAEDAFQAAFLILARKAASIHKTESLASWLYGVAYRVAARARGREEARVRLQRRAEPRSSVDPLEEVTARELLTVLDEELARLPERCRAALVLCYLQSKTCDDAARLTGQSVRTLKRRLEQGRERLRARLERRGLALPAALLVAGLTHGVGAAVPSSLIGSTVRAALQAPAAGAAALAAGVLRTMGAARARMVAAAVLLTGLLTLGAGALAQPPGADQPPQFPVQSPQPLKAQPKTPAGKADKERAAELTAAGRVLDSNGKPLAGAEVALVGAWRENPKKKRLETEVFAQGKTDEQGRFRLSRQGVSAAQLYQPHVLARAKSHGLGWLPVGAGREDADLKLSPETVLRGRLLDLQGLPAGNLKGRVAYVARKTLPGDNPKDRVAMLQMRVRQLEEGVTPLRTPRGFEFRAAELATALWPPAFTSDKDGRFELRGFGTGEEVHLLFEDDRFALQELKVETATKGEPKEVSLALVPPQRVEGRVICQDTGKPVAGADIWVTAFRSYSGKDVITRTDAEGRFAVNPYPGTKYQIRAWAPATIPYVGVERSFEWPRGAARQSVEMALVRGVEVKGRVVEAPAGKPLERVRVFFVAQGAKNPEAFRNLLIGSYWPARSAADGTYRLVVPPQPGHLLVEARDNPASADLVTRSVTTGELSSGKPAGDRRYHHEVIPVHWQVKDGPQALDIKLRRGVTLKGRVVGPDGKPVARAVILCGGDLVRPEGETLIFVGLRTGTIHPAIEARDGQFELPACDPDRTYRVLFLSIPDKPPAGKVQIGQPLPSLIDGKDALGACVEISARQAGAGPITVRLAPCGSVEVRFVDGKGKPVKFAPEVAAGAAPGGVLALPAQRDPRQIQPWLEVIVTPGQGKVTEERATLGGPGDLGFPRGLRVVEPGGQRMPSLWVAQLRTDAKGRMTISGLIPGATYRLRGYRPIEPATPVFSRDFTVEAGKPRQLEVVVPTP